MTQRSWRASGGKPDGGPRDTVGLTPRRSPNRRGLSLIEVLLAMTIFLISLVAIARLVDMGSDREIDSQVHTRGSRLALEKLAEVEAGAIDLSSTEGGFENDPEWSWTMTAEPQTAPNLYLVSVTVSRTIKGKRFDLTIAQMIFDPNYLGTAAEATRPDPNADPETTGGMP